MGTSCLWCNKKFRTHKEANRHRPCDFVDIMTEAEHDRHLDRLVHSL